MSCQLDPEVRTLLNSVAAAGGPPMEALPVMEARRLARERFDALGGEPEPVAHLEEVDCPGAAGPVRLRLYTPPGRGPWPALVYFHGGGWTVCDLDTHDRFCRSLARRAGLLVFAVDYRLAPEHPYPAAVDDCLAATRWVGANAARFAIDPERILVGGDSAGGTLATVVARKCRDEGGPKLAMQVLLYPVTNLAAMDTATYREFADGYLLTRAQMEWFARHYTPNPEDRLSPDVSPLLAPNLRGLPPAVVLLAECDVLRQEGEAYARRLEEAGVPVKLMVYPGVIHAFPLLAGVLSQGRKAVDDLGAALGEAMHGANWHPPQRES